MKKLLLVLALLPTLVFAQHYHHHGFQGPHWRYQGGTWNWMVPAIIGGVVVYETTKQQQQVVIQQPVVVQSAQNCSPWLETQNPDGTITRTRTCSQ
jgi:hypothetical protein